VSHHFLRESEWQSQGRKQWYTEVRITDGKHHSEREEKKGRERRKSKHLQLW
jgi:hypothetical protein